MIIHERRPKGKNHQGAHHTESVSGSPFARRFRNTSTSLGIKESGINPTIGQQSFHIVKGRQRGIEITRQNGWARNRPHQLHTSTN
jgi:hypothetical protein